MIIPEKTMRYLSVCSGIEAASTAWHILGWTPVAFSEIEPFPAAVLAQRFPDVPNWGDMTKWREWPDATVELLVGGTPCQSFSVAGLRQGLKDARGGLMLDFVGIAARYRPRWFIWENVPGVLSSGGGRDFGTLLGAMGDLGYKLAYRVLDAQWVRTQQFPNAVPQRRRRVFLVGYLGDTNRAAEVLFERESLRGNPPARRKARQDFTRDVAPSLVGSGRGVERTGESRGQDPVVGCWWNGDHVSQTLDAVLAKGQTMPEKNRFPAVLMPTPGVEQRWPADVAPTLHAKFGDKLGLENQHIDSNAGGMFVLSRVPSNVTHATPIFQAESTIICFEPGVASRDGGHTYYDVCGTIRSQPGDNRMTVAFHLTQDPICSTEVCHSLSSGTRKGCSTAAAMCYTTIEVRHAGIDCSKEKIEAIAIQDARGIDKIQNGKGWNEEGSSYTVDTVASQGVAICATGERTHTLTANGFDASEDGTGRGNPIVAQAMVVRRLTPLECERLQGFPDGHTDILVRNKPAADAPRYKSLGNSMAVNCMQFLGERINAADQKARELLK